MPSKLRKAIGAVKDQTSIGLAKVSSTNTISLDVPILKATSHDEVPVDERYLTEILQIIAVNKAYAAACAQTIGRRVSRTRNWIVALKSLMLVLRIFQDGDPHFPGEVLHAMKRGAKILNLSNFRDDSNSSPWDYTAFVRTFALYLDERLDCLLTGKLHRRFSYQLRETSHGIRRGNEPSHDVKPAILLDRMLYWQKLLDRAIATRPTGDAKTNRLVLNSLHAIVQESFELYRDISDGLALLLDSFFRLQYQSCVNAFQACVRASNQFEELSQFYGLCKIIGVGRTSEYPSVQKISDELIETLQEFLKDQASFPVRSATSNLVFTVPPVSDQPSSSEMGSRCTSLEDLMSSTETGTETGTSPASSIEIDPDFEITQKQFDFDESEDNPENCWEIALFETAKEPVEATSKALPTNGSEPKIADQVFDQTSLPKYQSNPFLQENSDQNPTKTSGHDLFSLDSKAAKPTFSAESSGEGSTMAPTFRANEGNFSYDENDPFETSLLSVKQNEIIRHGPVNEQSLLHEQQLWMENQKKIIAKTLS
ncbi:hypothetical protein UlMin_020808 [Ulmus minor]